MGVLTFILFLILSCSTVWAGTYYISPTGVATWANCEENGETPGPKEGVAACARTTANTSATAGDLVYYRAGTYSVSNTAAINPTNGGTGADAKITFMPYNSEEVIFQEGAAASQPITLAVSWVKITGFQFLDFQYEGYITTGGDYNEISYCQFLHPVKPSFASRIFVIGYSNEGATHNWFHHNYLSTKYGASPCTEGIDLLRVGMASRVDINNYNTVEYNYFEYSAHANIVTYSSNNVIRGNIGHNEPWIFPTDICLSYDGTEVANYNYIRGSTATDEETLSVANGKTLTIAIGLANNAQCVALADPWGCCTGVGAGSCFWSPGKPVALYYTSDWTKAMSGVIASYDGTTGAISVNIGTVHGGLGETYSNWIVTQLNMPKYVNAAYDNLYGHRVVCIGDVNIASAPDPQWNFVEGNRFGFAGNNPNNNGPSGLDFGGERVLIRYNAVYGNFAAGISEKGGTYAHIYNNTSYSNGNSYDFVKYTAGSVNTKGVGQGIAQYSIDGEANGHSYNVIKNNLVYGNGVGDICYSKDGQVASCSPWTGDTVDNNFCTLQGAGPCSATNYGDPLFVNPALTDPTSQNLISSAHGYIATPIPDLRLQSGSGAIDGGTYLTTIHADDTGSGTSLILTDPYYFQCGSACATNPRGASISNVQGDWIAVGLTVASAQLTQITDINYTTATATISPAITRSDGDYVWLYKKSDGTIVLHGSAPDYGAHEYVAASFLFDSGSTFTFGSGSQFLFQ